MTRRNRALLAGGGILILVLAFVLWPELFGALVILLSLALIIGVVAAVVHFRKRDRYSEREPTDSGPKRERRFPWGAAAKWAGAILLVALVVMAIVRWWPEDKTTASDDTTTPSPKAEACNGVTIQLSMGKEEDIPAKARRVTFSPISGCILVKAYDLEDELLLPEYRNCSDVKGHFQVPGGAGYRIVRPDPTRPASGLCVKS